MATCTVERRILSFSPTAAIHPTSRRRPPGSETKARVSAQPAVS